MKGYIVMEAEILDAEAHAEFTKKVPTAVAAHGGRTLVRTDNVEATQGDWSPKRLVILEFDSLKAARGYIGSAEYEALDEIRQRAMKVKTVIVEGYASEE